MNKKLWRYAYAIMSYESFTNSKNRKIEKLSKSMIRTFLKTKFSKNGKSVSNLITYPKISFQHAAERDLFQWKENGIQNRLTQNLTQILFKFF